MKTLQTLPKYDDLPNKHRYWEYGEPGSHEEGLGKLCLLTPEHVAASAKSEIRTGERVGLGWDMTKPEVPAFGRQSFKHTIIRGSPLSFDDYYEFNPQQSSQWDGFRHFSQPQAFSLEESDKDLDHLNHRVFYGGTTSEEIGGGQSTRIAVGHWAREGIVGRGILLDFARYAQEKGIKYSCFDGTAITYQMLKDVIDHFKVEVKPADMLFLRIGLPSEWNQLSDDKQKLYSSHDHVFFTGLDGSEDVVRFLWDNHFTVVAGDSITLEAVNLPMPEDGDVNKLDGRAAFPLHENVLCGFGVPFGELFNLDTLSEICKKHDRYSFFVTSMPFNAPHGVSSTPNIVAIF